MKKNPYKVVISRYVTEKSMTLLELQNRTSNKCISKCDTPKYVFVVDRKANKIEIRNAIEDIYSDKNVKVKQVNTINVHPKRKRTRGRSTYGAKAGYKKAIVTFEPGDSLEG